MASGGECGEEDVKRIRLFHRQWAAQGTAGQSARPPQGARRRTDQRRSNQIAPSIRMKQVELGPPARLVEQPVGAAGLLCARHLVDAVVEQGDVDPRSGLQELLQGDDLLRAVVPELAIIGY